MKKIIEKYRNDIKSIIKTFTGNYNEDLEQEVLIKTWQGLTNYKDEGKLKQWIRQITANTCRDYFRSAFFRLDKLIDNDSLNVISRQESGQNVENEILTKHRQKSIISSIKKLSPKYREVVILYEMKGLSYEEISKKLNCPTGTIKSRLYKARKELSVMLKEYI